jgi:superoxide dismutase
MIGRGQNQGENLDFQKLSEKERETLVQVAEGFGTSIAGLENLISTNEKVSKGLEGTLEDFDKKANSKFGTDEERKKALQQKDQAIMGAGQTALSALREKTSKDMTLQDAATQLYENRDFKNSREDMSAAMVNMASQYMAKKFGAQRKQGADDGSSRRNECAEVL